MQFKKSTLVMAVALAASPAAFASGGHSDNHYRPSFSKSYHEEVKVKVDNEASIKIKKSVTFDQNVAIRGGALVYGRILVNSSATAVVDDKQINHDNKVLNQHHNNNATVNGAAMSGARGNIGVNVAAGDNNMQDNAAAISAADARFVFGASDAEVFVNQDSIRNTVINSGNVNNASVNGNAFMGAAGNIGVNVAAGNSNLQKNNAAIAVSGGSLSTSTVSNLQQSGGNNTLNAGRVDVYHDTTYVTMTGRMNGGYGGYAAGGYAGTALPVPISPAPIVASPTRWAICMSTTGTARAIRADRTWVIPTLTAMPRVPWIATVMVARCRSTPMAATAVPARAAMPVVNRAAPVATRRAAMPVPRAATTLAMRRAISRWPAPSAATSQPREWCTPRPPTTPTSAATPLPARAATSV